MEARTLQIQSVKAAVCQICAVKIGFAHIAGFKRAAGQVRARKVGAMQHACFKFSFMCGNTREVALWQVARTEIDQQLPLQRAGKAGGLPHRLLNVADAVDGHLKSRFIVLALGYEFTEPFL